MFTFYHLLYTYFAKCIINNFAIKKIPENFVLNRFSDVTYTMI